MTLLTISTMMSAKAERSAGVVVVVDAEMADVVGAGPVMGGSDVVAIDRSSWIGGSVVDIDVSGTVGSGSWALLPEPSDLVTDRSEGGGPVCWLRRSSGTRIVVADVTAGSSVEIGGVRKASGVYLARPTWS